MRVKQLNQRHPEYLQAVMETHQDLYQGGAAFRSHIDRYMPKAFMEESSVYRERLERAVYENHCAPIIDQWVALVFEAGVGLAGAVSADDVAFLADVDRQGTDLATFFRDRLTQALIARASYVLVDLPSWTGEQPLRDRAEARAAGVMPYLVPVNGLQVLDWNENSQGQLESAMIYTERSHRSGPESGRGVRCTWTWYSLEGWKRWELTCSPGQPLMDDLDVPLMAEGLNPLNRLPLVRLALPAGLWLMQLLAEPALGYFNADNALGWSLYKSAFATLVLQTDLGAEGVRLRPGGYLGLERDDKYGYLEPSGRSFDAIDRYMQRRLEGLYRITKLMALGVANDSSRARASGEAKKTDLDATAKLLTAFGNRVRESIQACLNLVAELAGRASVQVRGLEHYEEVDAAALLQQAVIGQSLRVPSSAFQEALLGRVVDVILPDVSPELRATIQREIQAGVAARNQVEGLYDPLPPAAPASL